MSFCRAARLVMTPAREKLLCYLAARRTPANADMMAQSGELRGGCDPVTIYRTLGLFKDIDLVRRVGLHKKNSYFVLNAPGVACHYLICRHCEATVELPCDDPVQAWAERAAAAHGFTAAYHELEVYGVCPRCQSGRTNEPRPAKLRVGRLEKSKSCLCSKSLR